MGKMLSWIAVLFVIVHASTVSFTLLKIAPPEPPSAGSTPAVLLISEDDVTVTSPLLKMPAPSRAPFSVSVQLVMEQDASV